MVTYWQKKCYATNEVVKWQVEAYKFLTLLLLVPKLYYNLLSVSKTLEFGKTIEFSEFGCQILDSKKKLIAVATKVGCLNSSNQNELANVADQEMFGIDDSDIFVYKIFRS